MNAPYRNIIRFIAILLLALVSVQSFDLHSAEQEPKTVECSEGIDVEPSAEDCEEDIDDETIALHGEFALILPMVSADESDHRLADYLPFRPGMTGFPPES